MFNQNKLGGQNYDAYSLFNTQSGMDPFIV